MSYEIRTPSPMQQSDRGRLSPEASRFERTAGNSVAFLTSLVVHVALLLMLVSVAYRSGKPSDGVMLTAELGTSDARSLDLIQSFEIQPQMALDEAAPEATSAELALDYELEQTFQEPAESASGLAATLASLSTIGDVTSTLESPQRNGGASFFGAYAEGNRFIYVLDSSRSMKGDRWMYACNQLIDSLNGLKPGQEFFILCFDLETSYLFDARPPKARYFEADDRIVAQVRRWLRGRTLGRATMPAGALRVALEFNPDAIFLLSDGELQDNSLAVLRLANNGSSGLRQIPIHTVHLFSPFGRESLERIALENQGSFTHIDGR